MPTVDEFAAGFPNESVLQQALAKLFSKIPNHSGVQILQGSSEIGKDIIFYTTGAFGQKELNACVVKNTKITGNAASASGARTVFNQAQQALDTPLPDENGRKQSVKRVFIITPHPIPPPTVASIEGAIKASNERVQFISGASLLELFKSYWPDYLAEEFSLIQTYADQLTQAASVDKELAGLSFQYQLGPVDGRIKNVYVQPHFHRFVHAYSLQPLFEGFPKPFADNTFIREDSFNDIKDKVRAVASFIDTVSEWGLCHETHRQRARTAVSLFLDALTTSWSLAASGRAARGRSGVGRSESLILRLAKTKELNDILEEARSALNTAIFELQDALRKVQALVKTGAATTGPSLGNREDVVNKLHDLARVVGTSCVVEEDEWHCSFTSQNISGHPGSLLIVAPAGFGKTSFCRWHALNDLEDLLQNGSGVLPVYVPLHQVSGIERKDFKTAFLLHTGISALVPKGNTAKYERTRVYLDGLDEVAKTATQERIAHLAQVATESDPSLQVIITARDYVYGPWMTWITRVQLSGFDDEQIKDLVNKWLDNNPNRASLFFEQLDKSPSLREMMAIPLLATLTVLVFKQTDKLPENKTRLYEIFIDLHNGGWDLAKGVQRASRFSATQKMYLLKKLAVRIHIAKAREMREAELAGIVAELFHAAEWQAMRDELLRDGLLVQFGATVSFAHHSYQEFLTAKYLIGDPSIAHLRKYCEEYLNGADWWQEVLCFYLDLAGKPQETRIWLKERLESVGKSPMAEKRVLYLYTHLESSFPFAK